MISQVILNGIIAGGMYALMACGFSLIYNIVKFVDISLGGIYVVSAFLVYFFTTYLKINFILPSLLTIAIAALLYLVIYRFIYRPLNKKKASSMTLFLSSFAVFIILQNVILLTFGANVRVFNFPITEGFNLFGLGIITKTQIVILFTSLIFMFLLRIFLKKTNIGKAMRATADDRELASIGGINVEKIIIITFLIASVFASIAGILISLEQNIVQSMGMSAILKGITASIIGGIGNVYASILGGFLIGIVENLGILFLPSGYKDAIAFIILIIFLLFKPNGLFGVKKNLEK